MPRLWKLAVLAVLCLAFLVLLGPASWLVPLPDAAAATVGLAVPEARVKTAPSPPSALSKEPLSLQARLQERLLEPPEWHAPQLRTVLSASPARRTGAGAAISLPSVRGADLDAPAGNYATLRPRQLGEAYQAGARLQGTMFTVLRHGYSLSLQQQQNVALVPMSFDLSRGDFALHAESAGHYLITLHLSNPETTSYVFHNKLQRIQISPLLGATITTLVEQEETIQSGESFVVPCLLQLPADEWAGLSWHLRGGNVVFHALTVDKIG